MGFSVNDHSENYCKNGWELQLLVLSCVAIGVKFLGALGRAFIISERKVEE